MLSEHVPAPGIAGWLLVSASLSVSECVVRSAQHQQGFTDAAVALCVLKLHACSSEIMHVACTCTAKESVTSKMSYT